MYGFKCYIIKESFFYTSIIFHLLYFIIQFGKAMNYSSLFVQMHNLLLQFMLMRKGYDNHHCHNKPPDR